jgi:hypothetical protein
LLLLHSLFALPQRLLYLNHLLELDYRVLLFDVDQVWSANPFDFIDMDSSADFFTQNDGTLNRLGLAMII